MLRKFSLILSNMTTNIFFAPQGLFYIELPFAEDLRLYTFASLDNNKKCQPSDEQLSAIDNLIDNMDLMRPEE